MVINHLLTGMILQVDPTLCAIGSINSHELSIYSNTGKTHQPKSGMGFIGPHEIKIPVIKGGMSLSPI